MISFLYTASIFFYRALISLATFLGNKKAKLWIEGRKNWKNKLEQLIPQGKETIWIHVASLGEFEQARPLIEEIKLTRPEEFIILTFFSPSGYEIRKDYQHADAILYLPIDYPNNARIFIQKANPKQVIFIKYEFWFNYLQELKTKNIPTFLVSGIFRKNQHFFKLYGGFFRGRLKAFNHFFLQNDSSKKLLSSIGFNNSSVVGDTRLDRVIKIAKEEFKDSRLDSFCNKSSVIVFGSSWPTEHTIAKDINLLELNSKIIIAPHEIKPLAINELKSQFELPAILLVRNKKN